MGQKILQMGYLTAVCRNWAIDKLWCMKYKNLLLWFILYLFLHTGDIINIGLLSKYQTDNK